MERGWEAQLGSERAIGYGDVSGCSGHSSSARGDDRGFGSERRGTGESGSAVYRSPVNESSCNGQSKKHEASRRVQIPSVDSKGLIPHPPPIVSLPVSVVCALDPLRAARWRN